MRKILIIVMLLLSVTLMGNEVKWAKNYNAGLKEAQESNKPVLFIISRNTCKYCILLDKTTLSDDQVIDVLTKNFVSIRSWTNKNDYIPEELRRSTPGLPGIWFLLPNGRPMYQPILGAMGVKRFLNALEVVKKSFAEYQKEQQTAKKGK